MNHFAMTERAQKCAICWQRGLCC